MISATLQEEIDLKKTYLEKRFGPEYKLKIRKRESAALDGLTNVYSWWLENPKMRRQLLTADPKDRRNIVRVARKGANRVKEAWNSLRGQPALTNNLSRSLLWDVAYVVDPQNTKYRDSTATLGLRSYIPPNPIKIPHLIDEIINYVTNEGKSLHPVELAAYLHLKIAGIQAFNDGNKRVSRLLQNKALVDANLPVALIHSGERDLYIDLLESGLADQRDGKSKGVRDFYDFVGTKVNMGLDGILNDIPEAHRIYRK